MSTLSKRATVYFNPAVHNVLRTKAHVSHRSISEIINEVLIHELSEDAEDLNAFSERANEETISYEDVLAKLDLNV
ncbi:CopG family transcriptional regulator [Lentisphaera profundi]|uniref:CopG family transcriptional regulator n=1 Tax=Lentisphaera profundi TaxID=1658616 RepID=A0ABY7VQK1_9BACT|nr:CopG family transcriptional regulator [Lentisphaera profundi]WDE95594.1 CopG family transcriptional regulator [Lentisphaera profundi]